MGYDKPLPRLEGLLKPFWEAARDEKLVVQACESCGDMHFPPTPVCPRCLGLAQSWREVSGRGSLESWIDFHHVYWEGFRNALAYRVCLVRLAEGPLLISNLVDDSEAPKLGAGVHVVFDHVTEEVALPKFKLDGGP